SALRWDPGFVLMVFGIVVLAAFSLSLAPRLGPIPTPTFLVIQVVEMWRVFARLSLVVNIGLVVLASYGLALLLKRFKLPRARWGVFVIVFALIFLEYMTFAWRPPTFGYREVPEFYTWLSQQKDVSEIAEYPLEEVSSSDYPMYYGTYRAVHGKKLLNGIIPTQDTGPLRAALRDLMSPQTVPTLRALGIDFVVVHSYEDPGDIPGLLLERTGEEPLLDDRLTGQRGQVYGYRVLPGEEADYALVIGDGFHTPHKKSAIHVIQQMGHHGQLSVKRLPGRQSTQEIEVSWTSRSANEVAHLIEVRQEGVLLWSGVIGHEDVVIRFIADPNKPIDVMAVNPTTDATILLSNFSVN
ncbi:hypothetical protein IRY61_03560, partial [Candidatus Saccharibacteria bacterium]|nr:hypothetical protein [Candidatus Saccharibacteria bacterium]